MQFVIIDHLLQSVILDHMSQ